MFSFLSLSTLAEVQHRAHLWAIRPRSWHLFCEHGIRTTLTLDPQWESGQRAADAVFKGT
ncbi:mCG129477 [Mus musculus]|nr:mCG129477 [Mus musculus]